MNNNLFTIDFVGLGKFLEGTVLKTASVVDDIDESSYCDGFEVALGLQGNYDYATKTASRQVGRELMSQFIPYMLLDK